ncbi:MAG: hypothetical protein H6779_05175 [Candidatus Nomurabacteria bacterium]|nr:MAG: hypothetical protein H6779_05175 [Candidatus Nomurabacteria bacterium]
MTKRNIIIVAAVVILVIAYFLVVGANRTENLSNGISEVVTKEQMEEKKNLLGQGTLNDLLMRNENLECTIKYKKDDVSAGVVEGSYFTSQERLRGDFVFTDSGMQIVSSMIMKDGVMYTWSEIDGQKYGMKMMVGEVEDSEVETREAVPLDKNVEYDCHPWMNVDSSIFEEPKDIIFRDFGDVTNTGMEYGNIYNNGEASGTIDMEAMMREMEMRYGE